MGVKIYLLRLRKERETMKKIMIVEDDTVLNKTLAYNLISDGYEVVTAYSFSLARRLLSYIYHLALMDINSQTEADLIFAPKLKSTVQKLTLSFLPPMTGKVIC